MKKTTSWGNVSESYAELFQGEEGTYQRELILPNLLRLLKLTRDEVVLDLGCGQGFFSRAFFEEGARVVGVDISRELIRSARVTSSSSIRYEAVPAHKLSFLLRESVSKVVAVLALQNIENVPDVIKQCARVLQKAGTLSCVMTHPAFRVPKESSWGWDEMEQKQYRRIDSYLSEAKVKIAMHPGDDPALSTLTFHRPLQYYFKIFSKVGFCVRRLEEWNSHKRSQSGPRAKAEDFARKEIPLFIYLEAIKVP